MMAIHHIYITYRRKHTLKKRIFSVIILASLTLSMVPTITSAESFDDQIQQKDEKINNLKNQQVGVAGQITALEAEIDSINTKVADLEAKKDALSADTMKLQDAIATLNIRIAKREKQLKEQARDTQVKGGSTNLIETVMNADSIGDMITRVQAMTTIVNANNDLVKQQKADKEAVEKKVEENTESLAKFVDTQKELVQQQAAIANKQAELAVLKTTLAAEQATTEGEKADLQKKKADAEAEAARIAAEQEAARIEQERQALEAQKAIENAVNNNVIPDPVTPSTPSTPGNTGGSTGGSTGGGQVTPPVNNGGGNGTDHSGTGNAYPVGQCTWFVKNRAPWVGNFWGNANMWPSSARADGYTVNGTPAAGAVGVFAAGQTVGNITADPTYGHVVYVESYDAAAGTINISHGNAGPTYATLPAYGLTFIHR